MVDSITELQHALVETSGEERVTNFMAALLAQLRQRHVTILCIRETTPYQTNEPEYVTPSLSVLAENVLALSAQAGEAPHRLLSVLKTRQTPHHSQTRPFRIVVPMGLELVPTAGTS